MGSATTPYVAVLFSTVVTCSCGAGGRAEYDLPPIIALSTETPIPQRPELVQQCLPYAQQIADGLQYNVGMPQVTHSDKWGDIVRVALTSEGSDTATRIACLKNNVTVGVVP